MCFTFVVAAAIVAWFVVAVGAVDHVAVVAYDVMTAFAVFEQTWQTDIIIIGHLHWYELSVNMRIMRYNGTYQWLL